MASGSQTVDPFGDGGEVYEDAVDYQEGNLEYGEDDGDFEDAVEEVEVEVIDCNDIVAEQWYDAEGSLFCRFEGKKCWRK